jgi:hypothetical protein
MYEILLISQQVKMYVNSVPGLLHSVYLSDFADLLN